MTREEIENDIINTLFECTHSGEDDTISDKEFAEVLADKFINYEIDLLKGFVGLMIGAFLQNKVLLGIINYTADEVAERLNGYLKEYIKQYIYDHIM